MKLLINKKLFYIFSHLYKIVLENGIKNFLYKSKKSIIVKKKKKKKE